MFTTNSQNTEMTQMPVNEQVHNTLHVQWVIVQSLKKKKKEKKDRKPFTCYNMVKT